MNRRRSLVAVAALSLTVLTACGASAPPGRELADEMIDTLDVSDAVKQCMRQAVDDFEIDPDAGFESFDDMAQKAADDQPQAVAVMAEFESALAACNRR
ncbi:MAG TPA: hypothetical protein VK917_00820 [Ilumatobacter sp.]|nr:hypothetical protein [Ilumatobacter sp.]